MCCWVRDNHLDGLVMKLCSSELWMALEWRGWPCGGELVSVEETNEELSEELSDDAPIPRRDESYETVITAYLFVESKPMVDGSLVFSWCLCSK